MMGLLDRFKKKSLNNNGKNNTNKINRGNINSSPNSKKANIENINKNSSLAVKNDDKKENATNASSITFLSEQGNRVELSSTLPESPEVDDDSYDDTCDDENDLFYIPKPKPYKKRTNSSLYHNPNNIPSNFIGKNHIPTVPNEDEILIIEDFNGDVLTASNEIKASKEAKISCAFLSNGWFLINRDDKLNANIASIRQQIYRTRYQIKKELLVSLPTIRQVYERYDKLNNSAVSVRRLDKINGQEAQEFEKEYLGLIEDAYKINVSDIHVFVTQHETSLAFRVNSELDRFAHKTAVWGHTLCQAAFAMAGETEQPTYMQGVYQAARISRDDVLNLPKGVQSIRLQFSPLPGGGRYMVCRILKEGTKETKGIGDLGYQKIHVDTINQMRRQSEGITVIAGPTGSGKSTTLVVMLSSDMAENPGRNIITVEDPPEYVILGAAQFAVVNTKDEETKKQAFNNALGSALRSDPDTVMIGEIRDVLSAKLAFRAAMTGHRVYASLHANNALAIMNRLRDIGVEIYNLTEPSLVAGLIGQRLIRYICPHCRIEFKTASQELLDRYGLGSSLMIKTINAIDEASQKQDGYQGVFLTNEKGCSHCRKGITGRATVAETIAPEEDFMEHIRLDRPSESINVWLDKYDGLTMQEHALQKMTKGFSSPADVIEVTGDITKFNIENRADKVFGHLSEDFKK